MIRVKSWIYVFGGSLDLAAYWVYDFAARLAQLEMKERRNK